MPKLEEQLLRDLMEARHDHGKKLKDLDYAITALRQAFNLRHVRIGKKKRTLSAAARKRISLAQKARWAKQKKLKH